MIYKKVESFAVDRPLEIDTVSSASVVYLRKNIEAVPNVDADGKVVDGTHWRMDEAQLSREQYSQYQQAKEVADLVAENSAAQSEAIMQALSDAEADRELQAISETENTETIMQAISDLQADVAMSMAE